MFCSAGGQLPLADFAHALIEFELFEAIAGARGVTVALPGQSANALNKRLHDAVARLGGQGRAGRRPEGAGDDAHAVLHFAK